MRKRFLIPLLISLAIAVGYLVKEVVATSNPHTWTDGLVGYWSFDGQYTTSTAGTRDVSNTGNWGAFNGGVKPVAGISGQALSFDGVDDYVSSGDFGDPWSSFTVEYWLKKTTWNESGSWTVEVPIAKWNTAGGNPGWYVYLYYAMGASNIWKTSVSIYNGSGYDNNFSTGNHTKDLLVNWMHFVVTRDFDSKTVRIYHNGLEVKNNVGATATAMSNVQALTLGSRTGGGYFNGLIDEVRIYNKALSITEIQKHYAEGLERHQDLAINQK